jgi:hypothetical protein
MSHKITEPLDEEEEILSMKFSKTVDRLKSRLNDPFESEMSKRNLLLYLNALEGGFLRGHEDRYVVFNEGRICCYSFPSERSALDYLASENCELTLFQIPGLHPETGRCNHSSTVTFKASSDSFKDILVPIQLIINETSFVPRESEHEYWCISYLLSSCI